MASTFYIISLFPREMELYFKKGLFAKGLEKGLFNLNIIDLRSFAKDKHRKVDDYPYGYKKGMLLKADVIADAVNSIDNVEGSRLLYTCPKGPVLTQAKANELKTEEQIILLCGYYKGVDERIFELLNFERVSVGDVILSSGELPALMVVESIVRQLTGFVGKSDCIEEDSIVSGLLYPPEYTTPRIVNGVEVPSLLTDGNHKALDQWRRKQSLKETLFKKPNLLCQFHPSNQDRRTMAEILKEGSQ